MNNKPKPASRLSIIFILAVVISGSILTWFSINNISNLKELTEKRILEEQRELASRISNAVQSKFETITAGFKNEINPSGLMKDSLINTSANHPFIKMPFILKTKGPFLHPNFKWTTENSLEPKVSNRFKLAFRKGEEAEFAKKNLRTAKNHYLSCLSFSTGEYESVKAINALGRVSVKLTEYENAIGHYKLIVLDHFQETSEEGIPYVYFALQQLLKISTAENHEDIMPLIEFCLEKMEMGSIPLNFNTEELITQIMKWTQESTFKSLKKVDHLDQLGKNINAQLQFVNEYRNEMSEILKEENLDNHMNVGNDFKLVTSFAGNNQKLLLINTTFVNPAGFLIDVNILFDTIYKTELQNGFEFKYNIEFPVGYNSTVTDQNIIYTSQLSPYFPGQMIQIILSDEKVITDIIKRRSWIYGIATALLMLAMVLGVVLILRDVRRERNLMRLRSDFISNVTHELKTPLTSIYMFAESLLLKRIKKESDKEEYLSIILKESERLKRMINNILEFSKLEKGKSEYHFVDSNLSAVLHNAIHDLDYWFEKEKFEVVTDLDVNINAEVDPEKMKQVISNLLSNAIKYSTGDKNISIRLFKKSGDINLEIEDRGIGISEAHLPRIFEKYFRVDNKENISGTGLGLTVVKEIIEAHNGTISVTSQIGKGSIFTIILNRQIKET